MNKAIHQNSPLIIRKLDQHGVETWRYSGKMLERGLHSIRIEAYFNREDLPFHGIVLRRDDRFVETFFDDRWYNIFEIHDKFDDQVKCWYCNIGYPADITPDSISYRDLALDLLVFPDGRQLILDENEYIALNLSATEKEKSMGALLELQNLFHASMDGDKINFYK